MKNLFWIYVGWRSEDPNYRATMTDIGRSFLMRSLKLRRIPGMIRIQQWYRTQRPLVKVYADGEWISEITYQKTKAPADLTVECNWSPDEELNVMLSEEDARDGVVRMRPASYWPSQRWEEQM
jgi:hypothetical protein